MNRKIGMYSAAVNAASVLAFAVFMLAGFTHGCYFASMFIAFSFVPMMCAYAGAAAEERKTAGYTAAAFSAAYAAVILLVYFAQLTTVRFGGLTEQAQALLDFQQMGLFFSFDLLGYALMALSTFFAGLTLDAQTASGKWLKALLLIHGVFFISCLSAPMLGIFTAGGPAWIGILVLEFWCVYFFPVGVLSFCRFRAMKRN